MYKLIIVEDEEIVRSGLKNGTDWDSLGFQVVGTASNGIEALELIENQMPNVVLTDIRMPDMDGIELMKIIRQRHSDVEIVILSGYNDFEYARNAIKYGAYEYLTKPVDDNEFQRVFQEIYQNIRRKRQNLYNNKNEKTGEQSLDAEKLRDIFLSTLLSKPLDKQFIRNSISELNIYINENSYCIAALQPETVENGYNIDVGSLFKGETVKFLISNGYPYAIFEGVCIILLSKEIGSSYYDLKKDMKTYKEYLENKLNHDFGIDIPVSVGISQMCSGLQSIRTAFDEASQALQFKFYRGAGKVISYSDVSTNKPGIVQANQLNSLIGNLIEVAFSQERHEVARKVRELFGFIRQEVFPDITFIRIKCLELFVLIDNKLKEKGIVLDDLGKMELLYRDIFNKATIDDLQAWLITKLESIFISSKNASCEQSNSLLQQVKGYILKNIREKIYLNDIAATVHMSPNYLSAAFTKETGLNLSKYIMDVKIEKAKEYLAESDMRIQEISDELGFSDYRYFSTVFKKETGLTPLDYRTKNYK